mmetsp:Transcript_15865/g.23207  ORF Transcript_15865/g.23207 Transcript_15865/m.23207 type:complete len:144 (+) Transcript_15865:101-532(+)|eukprot:CAMPEP_0197246024 /NCGR_PEP_ID=MMETSP1429-20130617/10616_1 /TAXON_ID=49237 /ORGANISM="Chaetoceros  sp., Strain UNC1202" /LENGTH=143 /DNA_ID=CAMNT_0042706617 /DNA_START=74 /DNA_END=505 /DNA_ORIENTATION=+
MYPNASAPQAQTEEDYGTSSNTSDNRNIPNDSNARGLSGLGSALGGLAKASTGMVSAACQRAKQINENHKVSTKTKDAATSVVQGAKDIDEKHHVVDKTKKAAGSMYRGAKDFEQKHHVVEKTAQGVTKGLQFISSKLTPKTK